MFAFPVAMKQASNFRIADHTIFERSFLHLHKPSFHEYLDYGTNYFFVNPYIKTFGVGIKVNPVRKLDASWSAI